MSEQLKNKILNMEVAPPATAWDFIAARLDEQAVSGAAAVQLKMNHLEVTPPAFVWNKIEKELDKNAEKVIPINRNRNFAFLRYAAAAVVVGLLGLFVFRYFSNNQTLKPSNNQPIAATENNNQPVNPSNNPTTPDTNSPSSETISSSQPVNTSNRLPLETEEEYTKGTYAYNEVNLQKALDDAIGHRALYNPDEGVKIVARDVSGNVPSGINAVTAGNDYFITTGPNGEVVRVSNKLANIIQLLGDESTTEENISVIIRESAVWKQRFYNLRNKLSKLAPSPTNFMDIVELANALKEEKKP